MLGTILFSVLMIISLFFVLLTAWQLISKYRKHQMKEIRYDVVRPASWPTQAWNISSPEMQGVNSDKLLEMLDFYQQKN